VSARFVLYDRTRPTRPALTMLYAETLADAEAMGRAMYDGRDIIALHRHQVPQGDVERCLFREWNADDAAAVHRRFIRKG